MTYSSFLADHPMPLLLDASVLMNLQASGQGRLILAALPNAIVVPKVVVAELEHETSRGNRGRQFIHELVALSNVTIAGLTDDEYQVFEALVSGVSSLDDGEASAIAIASSRGYALVIDEQKGRLQAQKHRSEALIGRSLDLFLDQKVLMALGEGAVDALYLALRDGRMRVHEDHCEHVVGLIGVERALQCTCLPGYKIRRRKWELVRDSEAKLLVEKIAN